MTKYINEDGEYNYDGHDLESIEDAIEGATRRVEGGDLEYITQERDEAGWRTTFYAERHLRKLLGRKCELLQELREVLSAPAPRP